MAEFFCMVVNVERYGKPSACFKNISICERFCQPSIRYVVSKRYAAGRKSTMPIKRSAPVPDSSSLLFLLTANATQFADR
jgi:hypothetical protein